MVAPALVSHIIDFFYTGSTSLGILFLEVFTQEVPKLVICFTVTAVSMPVYCSGMLIWYVTFTSCHRWICMLSQKLGRTTNSSQLNSMMCSELWSTQEQLQMDQKQTETLQTGSKVLESPDRGAERAQMGQEARKLQCMILYVDSWVHARLDLK